MATIKQEIAALEKRLKAAKTKAAPKKRKNLFSSYSDGKRAAYDDIGKNSTNYPSNLPAKFWEGYRDAMIEIETKNNPAEIHIDVNSHNARKSARAKTNPKKPSVTRATKARTATWLVSYSLTKGGKREPWLTFNTKADAVKHAEQKAEHFPDDYWWVEAI